MLKSMISVEQIIRYIICAEQTSTEYFDTIKNYWSILHGILNSASTEGQLLFFL